MQTNYSIPFRRDFETIISHISDKNSVKDKLNVKEDLDHNSNSNSNNDKVVLAVGQKR